MRDQIATIIDFLEFLCIMTAPLPIVIILSQFFVAGYSVGQAGTVSAVAQGAAGGGAAALPPDLNGVFVIWIVFGLAMLGLLYLRRRARQQKER